MKKISHICFFILVLAISVSAQERFSIISVNGTAEVFVVPDIITFSLGVATLDKDLSTAKRKNDEIVSKVLSLTKKYTVLPQDIKTDLTSVQKEYEFVRNKDNKVFDEDGDEIGKKVFKGFEVSQTITIKLKDITKFEAFFTEVLTTGITRVKSIDFGTSKLREFKDKARELAMKAAQEKAKAMAGAIGQTIGKAVLITEGNTIDRGYSTRIDSNITKELIDALPSGTAFSELLTSESFAPGAIEVKATVTVSFILE